MRSFRSLVSLYLWLIATAAVPAWAQMTPVVASSVQMGGAPITQGRVTFIPVNSGGAPQAYSMSGGGLNVPVGGFGANLGKTCQIVNGAIVGSCQVADASTTSPSGLLYNVIISDTSSGNPTSGKAYTLPRVPGISGASWSLDLYSPITAASLAPSYTYTQASGAPTGPCAGPSLYGDESNPARVALYACRAGVYVPSAGNSLSGSGGVPSETRTLHVATVEPGIVGPTGSAGAVPANSTVTLMSATGPGSVERIQFAAIGGPDYWGTSTITITVDGQSYTSPLGIFLLTYGIADEASNAGVMATKNLGLSAVVSTTAPEQYADVDGHYPATDTANFGGYRKLYIPYQNSISISYTNLGSGAASIFTQIDYYPGTPPAGLHPSTQKVFHMYTGPALASIAPFAQMTWLPEVDGIGQLDSIYFFALGTSQGASAGHGGLPFWMEGNPTIQVDGYTYQYGGTEDFFGCQFYCVGSTPKTDEMGFVTMASSISGTNTYTGMYRYFHDYPMVFTQSISASWQNGQPNEPGPQLKPPTINASVQVVYYTGDLSGTPASSAASGGTSSGNTTSGSYPTSPVFTDLAVTGSSSEIASDLCPFFTSPTAPGNTGVGTCTPGSFLGHNYALSGSGDRVFHLNSTAGAKLLITGQNPEIHLGNFGAPVNSRLWVETVDTAGNWILAPHDDAAANYTVAVQCTHAGVCTFPQSNLGGNTGSGVPAPGTPTIGNTTSALGNGGTVAFFAPGVKANTDYQFSLNIMTGSNPTAGSFLKVNFGTPANMNLDGNHFPTCIGSLISETSPLTANILAAAGQPTAANLLFLQAPPANTQFLFDVRCWPASGTR